MFGKGLTGLLIVTLLAGPWFCCCTPGRLLAGQPAPAEPPPDCCCHATPAQPDDSPHPAQLPRPKCPCSEQPTPPWLSAPAAGFQVELPRAHQMVADLPALLAGPGATTVAFQPESFDRSLPSPQDILSLLQILRC
jgi:hypothetical protein